jgi:hypothetical protein
MPRGAWTLADPHEPGALGLLSTYCPFTFFRKISSNWSGVFFARIELNWLR